MLKQRVITAAVLLPLAIVGFFGLKGLAFALFIGWVVTLGAWEWARLAGCSNQLVRVGYAALMAGLLFLLYRNPSFAMPVIAAGVIWWVVAIALVMTYPDSSRYWGGVPGSLLLGLLVLLPAWQGLQLLKLWPEGNWLILSVMALVWVADIGAYFFGRAFGRRKLAPKVSPGKSWEGLLGGLFMSLLGTLAVVLFHGWPMAEVAMALAGAAAVVLISVVGDLSESMFKRSAGVKDSSQLLPGHGGVLDRIDSLTAAVPVFVLLLWLAGWGV